MKPQETPRENAAIQKGTEFLFNKSEDRPVALLLSGKECFQLSGDDLIQDCRFRIPRAVCDTDSHEGIASSKPARNPQRNILTNMRGRRLDKSVSPSTTLSRLSPGCRRLSAGGAGFGKMPE